MLHRVVRYLTFFAPMCALVWVIPNMAVVEIKCAETAKVEAILALKYRDAVIRLSDGREITVNQATLNPGDDYCIRWKRVER